MPTINATRLLDDLYKLRAFGACGKGVVRTAFSAVDIESRNWLRRRCEEAGLEAGIDGVGNVIGLSRTGGPSILMGSHSDTQPTGGWLDGAYGVICALEVARTFAEDPETHGCAIDVASWMDEEGTFLGSLGSLSYCRLLTRQDLQGIVAADGRVLGEVLLETGMAGNGAAAVQPERQVAYLEAHIEQGPVLDTARQRIGVVTGIVGVRDCTFSFTGEQNHAGTTPMQLRKDAAAVLIEVAASINRRFPDVASEASVWTIGAIELATASPSIVPGQAEMKLQIRDLDDALLDQLEQLAGRIAEEYAGHNGVRVNFQVDERAAPAAMNEQLQECIRAAAEHRAPGQWRDMPSGAAHDAQVLAAVMPAGMVFVPSIGGVSHSFLEDTDTDDLVLGCQVLCDAALNFFREYAH